MKFIEVDPEEIPNLRDSHRGRVSYPILKSFLETGKPCVMLDRTGIQQSLSGLTSCLGSYIRNHKMPIKMFTRDGQIYLLRLDLNADGSPNPKYSPDGGEEVADEDLENIELVDSATVKKRFEEEKGKVTK